LSSIRIRRGPPWSLRASPAWTRWRCARGLPEDEAYKLLRKLSMDTGRPLAAVAADLLAFAGVLKGKPE
jgi:hypothetical protein